MNYINVFSHLIPDSISPSYRSSRFCARAKREKKAVKTYMQTTAPLYQNGLVATMSEGFSVD